MSAYDPYRQSFGDHLVGLVAFILFLINIPMRLLGILAIVPLFFSTVFQSDDLSDRQYWIRWIMILLLGAIIGIGFLLRWLSFVIRRNLASAAHCYAEGRGLVAHQPKPAISMLTHALDHDPDLTSAYYFRALAHIGQFEKSSDTDELDKGVLDISAYLTKHPGSAAALTVMGLIESKQGNRLELLNRPDEARAKLNAAREHYQGALEAQPRRSAVETPDIPHPTSDYIRGLMSEIQEPNLAAA